MGFPLFNVKELDAPPVGGQTPALASTKSNQTSGASCPVEPAKPTTYLRDLVVILLVFALLAGVVGLAYYFPRWL